MLAHNTVLIGIELLAGSTWIGSFVCLAVVSSAARASLDASAQVAFFRALGRRFNFVGNLALATTVGVGIAMLWPPSSWGRLQDAAVAIAGGLVLLTALGVRQARAMTRIRRRHLDDPSDTGIALRVRQGARRALLLRGMIGVGSIGALSMVALLLGR